MVAKKATAKKSVAKKAPAKKSVLKKPARKSTSKQSVSKRTAQMKSFHLYKETRPFTMMQPTRQTLYWVILLAFIIFTQLWILRIQIDIANVTALLSNR